jgi:hypothetical protein
MEERKNGRMEEWKIDGSDFKGFSLLVNGSPE